MPRAASPAADAAMPETAAPEPAAPDTQTEPAAPVAWTNWLYQGPDGRIYTSIPVTVQNGDVIANPGIPAEDGSWKPTDAEVTRQADNHPDTIAAANKAALAAAEALAQKEG